MKIFTIGFLGSKGGKAKKLCNIPLIVESDNTARIQESHIFLGHYIFEEVEKLSHYTNLQPMWATENIKKSNKIL